MEFRLALLRAALLFLMLASAGTQALANDELRDNYRGLRETALGGAYAAVADDEESLWLNPAGLAGIKNTQFHYATVDLEFSNDLASEYLSGTPSMNALSAGNFNALMGKDFFARAQYSAELIMPKFGIGIISDHRFGLLMNNQTSPTTTVPVQSTNGIQIGTAFSFKKRSRKVDWGEIRVGIAGKVMWRRGGYMNLDMIGLMNLMSQLQAKNYSYLYNLPGSYGMGYGADLGLQYIRPLGRSFELSGGLTWQDIGDTAFPGGGDTQPQNLSLGAAIRYNGMGFGALLAADYRNMTDDTDPRKRAHVGLELKLPMLTLYGSLNQMLPGYGVGFDAWLFRITALTYQEALGQMLGQDDERRWMLRADMKFTF